MSTRCSSLARTGRRSARPGRRAGWPGRLSTPITRPARSPWASRRPSFERRPGPAGGTLHGTEAVAGTGQVGRRAGVSRKSGPVNFPGDGGLSGAGPRIGGEAAVHRIVLMIRQTRRQGRRPRGRPPVSKGAPDRTRVPTAPRVTRPLSAGRGVSVSGRRHPSIERRTSARLRSPRRFSNRGYGCSFWSPSPAS